MGGVTSPVGRVIAPVGGVTSPGGHYLRKGMGHSFFPEETVEHGDLRNEPVLRLSRRAQGTASMEDRSSNLFCLFGEMSGACCS